MDKKAIFSTSLIYFIVVCLFVLVRMLSHFGVFAPLGDVGEYVINAVMQVGVLLIFPLLTYKLMNKKTAKGTFQDFNYTKVSYKVVLIALGLGVVVYFLNVFVSSFFYTILASLGYESPYSTSVGAGNGWTLVLGLVFTAILPAICEENLNRGMLLSGTKGLGMVRCVLLNGLMFGLLHLNIEQFFYAALIGCFLGFIVYVTDSIYPCMIIHFMNNGIGVLLSFLTQQGAISGGVFTQLSVLVSTNFVLGFFVMFFVILALVVLLIVLTRLLLRTSVEESFRAKQREFQNLLTKFTYFDEIVKLQNNGEEIEDFSDINELKGFLQQNPEAIVITRRKVKMNFASKVLFTASIVLAAAVTIFTFVWGVI